MQNTNQRTTVVNLDTGDKYIYSLNPEKAVVRAYNQLVKGNQNSWEYKYDCSELQFGGNGYTVSCGNMVALINNVVTKD